MENGAGDLAPMPIYDARGARRGTIKSDDGRFLIYDRNGQRTGSAVHDGNRLLIYDANGRRKGQIQFPQH